MAVTPPSSLHYLAYGLNPTGVEGEVTRVNFIKFDTFEPGNDIKTDEDKGHMGAYNSLISKDRTSAEGAPSVGDKLRFGEGIEDFMYMLLGSMDTITAAVVGATIAKSWHIFQDVSDPSTLPLCSMIQGFNWGDAKPEVYVDAVANKFELTLDADKSPSYKMTFLSDFPMYNQDEPTITFGSTEYRLKANQGAVYIGPVNTTYNNLKNNTYKMDCYTKASLELSNNIESKVCGGTQFGKPDKAQKPFTGSGKVTMDYNEGNMNFEAEWATGDEDGIYVSPEPLQKAVLFSFTGKLIETVDGTPDVPVYMVMDIYIPSVDMKYTSKKDGEDAKEIEAEFDIVNTGLVSAVDVYFITPLDELNEGTAVTP